MEAKKLQVPDADSAGKWNSVSENEAIQRSTLRGTEKYGSRAGAATSNSEQSRLASELPSHDATLSVKEVRPIEVAHTERVRSTEYGYKGGWGRDDP
ncbi:hypothetical protein CSOJ01_06235 [Colletotrichum sojae]|uniref:Uncharacterized protein n=1 Tax=Colletotrichum sojae TaxID=2175907 RepID=A0A8H6MWC0_9PEZI|nr:hypothetical protein CSOJ01_06235 [Colletotrichum sojae]